MSFRRFLPALLLASGVLLVAPAQAQSGPTYEVRRGDSLFAIARKTRHDSASRNQMILAIWRANQSAFPSGDINLLEVGTVLVIPPAQAVTATPPSEADRLVREMLAKAATPTQVAAVRPPTQESPSTRPAARPGAAAPASAEEAARMYSEALALERKGDEQGAFRAFLRAAEAGHGLAQRRLGQIYDKGNTVVQRDYQASLRWYQKAREQGVEIDKPVQRMTTK